MTEQPPRRYLVVTVDPVPSLFILDEEAMPRKNRDNCTIFHSWLRSGASGVVGMKFSSWMIKLGKLSPTERQTVTGWNKSESDFEVFFGSSREYDKDDDAEDEAGSAYLLRLEGKPLAICFPIYGPTLKKGDAEALHATLKSWTQSA